MNNDLLNLPQHFRTFIKYHELIRSLVYRQIHARYRQSALGIWWAVFRPLATLIVFTVVFSYIAKFSSDGLPYPIFAFGALLCWNMVATGIQAGVPSLVNQRNLVTKLYFPRETLPVSAIMATGIDFLISFVLFVGLMFFYGIAPTWNILWAIPILFCAFLLSVAVTLFLSVVNVWYRDVTHALGLLIQFWMYLSPIIYPYSMVPERYHWLYDLNPVVGIIEGFRTAVLHGQSPKLGLLLISIIITFGMLGSAYVLFKYKEFEFADII